MKRRSAKAWILFAGSMAVLPFGCGAGGVGDPCTPEDEYYATFSGYQATEANIESRSFQCETRVCIVNHFRGRVSCPYGQSPDDITQDPDGSQGLRCKIPGTKDELVTVPVDPQFVKRRGDDTVYCSCRCKNIDGKTDDGARYCECPSGYDCDKLVLDPGLGTGKQLAGYYCIKQGTEYKPSQLADACSRSIDNCSSP